MRDHWDEGAKLVPLCEQFVKVPTEGSQHAHQSSLIPSGTAWHSYKQNSMTIQKDPQNPANVHMEEEHNWITNSSKQTLSLATTDWLILQKIE